MTGPTGVGKSAFACALAERVGGEIIGADAFQLYRGIPVLTAQAGDDLQARVPHHLTGVLDLADRYDAALFLGDAEQLIREIQSRNRVPILAGGTGLYLKALTHGLAKVPPPVPELRAEVNAMTISDALARLQELDAVALGQIDTCNPVRVRRALEIVIQTGKPLAASRTEWKAGNADIRGVVLMRERQELRRRIEENVAAMFAAGVCSEVARVRHAGDAAKRAIGFREIEAFLDGDLNESECREAIIHATWKYAKRQMTWARTQFAFASVELTGTNFPGESVEEVVHILEGRTGIPD